MATRLSSVDDVDDSRRLEIAIYQGTDGLSPRRLETADLDPNLLLRFREQKTLHPTLVLRWCRHSSCQIH
jgi:hypothetical protein